MRTLPLRRSFLYSTGQAPNRHPGLSASELSPSSSDPAFVQVQYLWLHELQGVESPPEDYYAGFATDVNNLGNAQKTLGDPERARRNSEPALRIFERFLGEGPFRTQAVRRNLEWLDGWVVA